MKAQKTNEHLSGVRCVVNTCEYYDSGDYCTASNIQIQPKNAKNTQETDCGTFSPKGGMQG